MRCFEVSYLELTVYFYFCRENITRPDLYQYRLQAWDMSNMNQVHLPDFSQSNFFV